MAYIYWSTAAVTPVQHHPFIIPYFPYFRNRRKNIKYNIIGNTKYVERNTKADLLFYPDDRRS